MKVANGSSVEESASYPRVWLKFCQVRESRMPVQLVKFTVWFLFFFIFFAYEERLFLLYEDIPNKIFKIIVTYA